MLISSFAQRYFAQTLGYCTIYLNSSFHLYYILFIPFSIHLRNAALFCHLIELQKNNNNNNVSLAHTDAWLLFRARNCITTSQPALSFRINHSYCRVSHVHPLVITRVWLWIRREGAPVIRFRCIYAVSTEWKQFDFIIADYFLMLLHMYDLLWAQVCELMFLYILNTSTLTGGQTNNTDMFYNRYTGIWLWIGLTNAHQ